MRSIVSGLLALSFVFVVSDRALAKKCGDDPGDNAAVAAARAQVATDCPCGSAANHGEHVRCAAQVANALADADALPKSCKGEVVKCAAKTTCGKPGFVTCCRTNSKGQTKCSTKKDASKCKPPKGGSVCVGATSSCCDACAGGCGPTPTPGPTATPSAATPSPAPTQTPYGSALKAFIDSSSGLLQ
jgi:hypothetical protein